MLKKKMVLSMSIMMVLMLVVAGATMAWFTDKGEATSVFTAGTVEVELTGPGAIDNLNPGDEIYFGREANSDYLYNDGQGMWERILNMRYTGNKAAYLKVKFKPEWEGQLSNENINVRIDGDNDGGIEWSLSEGVDAEGYYVLTPTGGANPGVVDGTGANAETGFGITLPDPYDIPLVLEVDGEETDNDYQGKALNVDFRVEVVQFANVSDPDAVVIE